jgi:hypothetical protein
VQRREVSLYLHEIHALLERSGDAVVHVLREGQPASGSFVNRTRADESQWRFGRHARSTHHVHRQRRSRDFTRPPRRVYVLRASLQERRARREVRRVEGTKNEDANDPHDDEKVEISGATSDDFSTISPNFETNFTNKVVRRGTSNFTKFRKKCRWFQLTCHILSENKVMCEVLRTCSHANSLENV